MTDKTLTIRLAEVADAGALARLAALDSSSPPTGAALVAEVGDELWAAIEIDSGTAIADPFRPSGELSTCCASTQTRRVRPERRAARTRAPARGVAPGCQQKRGSLRDGGPRAAVVRSRAGRYPPQELR